jgi:site-specific DNA recombinase
MGSEIRLRPNPVEFYRKKVAGLAATLADPEIRPAALETIRGLITRVTVFDSADGITLALDAALTAMIGLAQNDKSPPRGGLDDDVLAGSVEVVAETRSHRSLHTFSAMCDVGLRSRLCENTGPSSLSSSAFRQSEQKHS